MITQLTRARAQNLAAQDVARHLRNKVIPNLSEYNISVLALEIATDGSYALMPGKLLLAWSALRYSDCASLLYDSLLNRQSISVKQQKNDISIDIDIRNMFPAALSDPRLHNMAVICCSYDVLRYDIQNTIRRRRIFLPHGMHRATHIFRYIRAAEMKINGRENSEISRALGHVSDDAVCSYIDEDVVSNLSQYL